MKTPRKLDVTAIGILAVYFLLIFIALLLHDAGEWALFLFWIVTLPISVFLFWYLAMPISMMVSWIDYPSTWESGGWEGGREDLLASSLVTTTVYLLVKIILTIVRWQEKRPGGGNADG